MNQPDLAAVLNTLLATESRGLARHLLSATPYLSEATFQAWGEIRRMLRASDEHARRLSQLLDRLGLAERPASFDPAVAACHFSDLAHLLDRLVDEKRRQVAAYQRALGRLGSNAEYAPVDAELRAMLGENQNQLQQLEELHHRIAAGAVGAR